MAILLNDRDKALQAAAYRSKVTSVTLTASAGGIITRKNGGPTEPSHITLTATTNQVFTSAAIYTYAYAVSNAPTTWITLGTGTFSYIISSSTFINIIGTSSQIQYRCTVTEPLLDTAYGFVTVLYTKEVSEPIIVNISRTNAVLISDYSGIISSYNNTDTTITVTRGTTSLIYSNTPSANSFKVSIDTSFAAGRIVGPTSNTTTSWTLSGITDLSIDGAKVVFIITVLDASSVPVSPTIGKEIVYNKLVNGIIGSPGADGSNIYPSKNYDFAGATLPLGISYTGTTSTYDSDTTTLLNNTTTNPQLIITNISLVPANNYLVSVRIKRISGPWYGRLYYSNSTHGYNSNYYATMTEPIIGVWTTVNTDMRTLTVGNTELMSGGNITGFRLDIVSAANSSYVIDYITIGKFGVAEATKSTTIYAYIWSNTGAPTPPNLAFTYNWDTKAISAYPTGWTSYAPGSPTTGTGWVVYQFSVVLSTTSTTATSIHNWNEAGIPNTIGYRVDGTIGPQGQSARTAYIVTTSATIPTTPTALVGDQPPTNWSFTAATNLTSGQYMYQSDGILAGTVGNTTSGIIYWGPPYLSTLKVGSLSAISANLGSITAGYMSNNTGTFVIDLTNAYISISV